jgi:type IV pilus assembly protein PilM
MILDKNHSPSFTRDLFVGSQDISKQIATQLGVSFEKANELKLNPGERRNEILKACEPSIQSLVAEIQLSLEYFKTEKNSLVSELFLVGGGSLLQGIEESFEKSLNIPVKVWNPLAGIKLGALVSRSDIQNHSSQLGVAIGLALTKV